MWSGRAEDGVRLMSVGHAEPSSTASYLAPLVVDGAVVATIGVDSPEPLAPEVTSSLETLRDHLALALEATRLADELRDRVGERRLAALTEHSADVITVLGRDATIGYQTASVLGVLGYRPGELAGQNLVDVVHAEDVPKLLAVLAQARERGGASEPAEWRTRHRDGSWRQTENVANDLRGNPLVGAMVVATRDVTERKLLEQELSHQALHDGLTQLANRSLFRDRAEHALARTAESHGSHAVLFLDVDDFKNVNDTLGHLAGDELLVEIAGRLRTCCRRSDTVSRLGGDEFAVLLEDIDDPAEAIHTAERIANALGRPFTLAGRETFVSVSIGIAVRSGEEEDVGEILRNADIAMYMAKERGKGRHAVFDASMHAEVLRRLELEADLRRAIEHEELFLEYQPIVALADDRIIGVEALVRWRHPSRGVLAPLEFIGAAERTGTIVPLGRWVLREACLEARTWQDAAAGGSPLTMNVNVSARQLQDPGFVDDVRAALSDAGLPPASLTLEITETAVMNEGDVMVQRLGELSALGIRLAVDDFGTGYSSLSYLRRFPVHVLKIAKPFVDDMASDPDVMALAKGIVELGRTLRLQVIAEGVETPDQVERLRSIHCDMGQGFSFARPMDRSALGRLLAEQASRSSPAARH
jgi:diguanylate cyclase (GGDEF)-like protein/PAS domain S-box-containing protein